MKLSVISFTEKGMICSEKLQKKWERTEITLFTKWSGREEDEKESSCILVTERVEEWAGSQMREKQALLFIGACGIAVRAIAPHLGDKLSDSPVLVMDEKGKYVIPILSGHMGGANELAVSIAERMGAVPVITTATDVNRKFAVDLFAKKNNLSIGNKDGIVRVSSKVLDGKEILLSIEPGHMEESLLPENFRMAAYPPREPVDILITSEDKGFDTAILLKPREYVIGMGCKKGKELEKIEEFIQRHMRQAGISIGQVMALVSIDLKADEPGFVTWSRKKNIPFLTYTAEQLREIEGQFHGSAFVKEKVGVDNVCERAALRSCEPDGKLIYKKCAEDGMTIAIAKRQWKVVFDEP